MKATRLSVIAIALAALSAGQAFADAPKTREQVRAELADAQRNGTLIADGETGATFRERFPSQYPAAAAVAGKTRAEVQAELRDAIARGDVIADGQTGAKANELFPAAYLAAKSPAV